MIKNKIKPVIEIILIIFLFVFASYIVQNNLDFFKNFIGNNYFSIVFYILILILSSVVAPIDVIFLMPIATALWGWFFAGLISLVGWTLGSALVFFLSRKYGALLIKKFISLDKIYEYEKFLPEKNMFAGVILLRIAIPIDLVSYAIGLFTKMKFIPYIFATIIGFTPLVFFLAYIGSFPIYMQMICFILLLLVILITLLSIKNRHKRKIKKSF